MNAVNEMTTPINSDLMVEAEEYGLVTVLKSMYFHAGYSRELEVENQNPSSVTTKVYVVLRVRGPYIANAVESSTAVGGFRLTHLQPLESTERFMRQISREVDRAEEGLAFLLSALSYA